MKNLILAIIATAAALVSGAPVAKAEILESGHATIEYDPLHGSMAFTVAQTIDDVYPEMYAFFAQINGFDAAKVPVLVGNTAAFKEEQHEQLLLGGDEPLATVEAHGAFRLVIDPDNVSDLGGLKTTVIHELFHHLSYRSGVVQYSALSPQDYWLVEGTAEVAEYYFNTPNTHKRLRFENYLHHSARHQNVGLLNAAHYAAFFVYYLMEQNNQSFQELMSQYSATKDGAAVAGSMGLDQYWADFTKAMFNRDPVNPIIVDGSPLTFGSGENLAPNFGEPGHLLEVPQTGTVKTEIALPSLSWQHVMLNVDPGLDWFDVHFGDLGDDPDFIVHAFLKKKGGDTYTYEDWTDKTFRRVCNEQEGPCKNEQLDDVQKVALIMGNISLENSLDGTLVAGGLGKKWKLKEMQVSQTLIVPATGEDLTLEFGPDGVILVKSKGWWLKFPPDHFPPSTSSLAYKYVNKFCRFKGFVKFQRMMNTAKAEYEEDKARVKLTWKTGRIEKGGLVNTPSGWWCDFQQLLLDGGTTGGVGTAAAIARTFTNLNTKKYPSGSFASKLSGVMKAMMSLQVPPSGSKELVMYKILEGPGANELQVELQGNVRAFFTVVE